LGSTAIDPRMYITAYHGTPHEIIGGKFDLSKIGTGEGAQVYGHGLYFAENPEVAKSYIVNSASQKTPEGSASSYVQDYGSYEKALEGAKKRLNVMQYHDPEQIQFQKDTVKALENKNFGGNLYKVDIADETIPKMLDWDKPLTQQPKEVKNFAANMAKSTDTWNNYFSQLNAKAQKLANEMISGSKPIVGSESAKYWKQLDKLNPNVDHNAIFDSLYDAGLRSGQKDVTGSSLYNVLTRKSSPEAVSSNLLKSGISGIRYLDQGSRGAGQGTSNYVVFDPNTVKILERNKLLLP